jgi:hypothetical protein
MEQLKIGDLVRRDEQENGNPELEGTVTVLTDDGYVSELRLTKAVRDRPIGYRYSPNMSSQRMNGRFYLAGKHPAIKTKFLGGYIE